MGRGRASVLLMLGEAVSAEQALAGGLVTEVVAPDALAGRAAGAAHALASKPPQALRLTKRMMGDADLLQIMEEEQAVFRSRLTTDEFREAVEALRRKIKTSAKHTAS